MTEVNTMAEERQLAIIRRPKVAVEDHSGELCVWFDAYTSECGAALQIVAPSDPDRFLSVWNAMAGNVANLDGKACWVAHPDRGLSIFDGMCNV